MSDDFDFASQILADIGKSEGPGSNVIQSTGLKQSESLSRVKGEDPSPFADRVFQAEKLRQSGVHAAHPTIIDKDRRTSDIRSQLQERGFENKPLGEPGLTNYVARADIGLSDTFLEKQKKFLTKFPDGDFVEVNEPDLGWADTTSPRGGKTIMFRRMSSEPFAELDARMLDKFELLGDLSDMAADVPATAAEAFMTRGGSLARMALQVASGSVVGDAAKEVLESLRGYQYETLGEQASRIGARAIAAATGAVGTGAITGPLNFARGAGIISKFKPGSKEAVAAGRELGMPNFLAHQIADSPILQKLAGQSRALTTNITEYVREQHKSAVWAMSRLGDKDALKIAAVDGLDVLHKQAIGQIVGAAKKSKVSLAEGGNAIKNGVAEYSDLSQTIVGRLYEASRLEQAPRFNFNGVVTVARQIRAGVRGAAADGGEDVQLKPVHGGIDTVLEMIENLDPSLPELRNPDGSAITATDQLRALRENLWHLKTVSPIGATPEQRATASQANRLYAAVTRALENPVGASDNFRLLWGTANTEARKRFETLEKIVVIEASRTEEPTKLAARLAQPLLVDNLQALKESVTPPQWNVFQQSAKAYFLEDRNLAGLTRRLDEFDKETLDVLLSPADQADLRFAAKQADLLQKSGIKEALDTQLQVQDTLRTLTAGNDKVQMNAFLTQVDRTAPNHPIRRTIRAAVMEEVTKAVVKRGKDGVKEVQPKVLEAQIERLRETGLFMRVLTPEDRRVLKGLADVAPFLDAARDMGTSLQSSEAVAGIRKFSSEAVATLVHAIGMGRFLISPVGQRILLGTGAEKLPFAKTRVLGAVLAKEALDLNGGVATRADSDK